MLVVPTEKAMLEKLVTDPPTPAMIEYLTCYPAAKKLLAPLMLWQPVYASLVGRQEDPVPAADALKEVFTDRLDVIKGALMQLCLALIDARILEAPPAFPFTKEMAEEERVVTATVTPAPQAIGKGADVIAVGDTRRRRLHEAWERLTVHARVARMTCSEASETASAFFSHNARLAEVILEMNELCEPSSGAVDIAAIRAYTRQLTIDFTAAAYLSEVQRPWSEEADSHVLFRSLRSYHNLLRNPDNRLLFDGTNHTAHQLLLSLNQLNPKLSSKVNPAKVRSKTPVSSEEKPVAVSSTRPTSGGKKRSNSQEAKAAKKEDK